MGRADQGSKKMMKWSLAVVDTEGRDYMVGDDVEGDAALAQ